jgi:hypothetical protein
MTREEILAFIRTSMEKGFRRVATEGKPATEPVEGHEGHNLVELPTGGKCHRRVLCVTCEVSLIDTFVPAEFLRITIEQAKETP